MGLTQMMGFEVKKENAVEVADWRQQQQQHQHYENYGKTEQVFDSQLPPGDNDYYSIFEGLPSLSENGFSLPILPESPQPQVPSPSDTPVSAGCGTSRHSYMEIPSLVPDQYQSSRYINLPDHNSSICCCSTGVNLNRISTWREFETGISACTLKVDYLQQSVNTGYSSSQESDANNYSFSWNMSSFDSFISLGEYPATDTTLLPEITNTENPENPGSESNSDSDFKLKDTDVKGFKKRKRNSSRQRRTINGFSRVPRKEKRQKLQDASASALHDEFDSNTKVGDGVSAEAIQVNDAVWVEFKVESSEGETDDIVMDHGIMREMDEFLPKDIDLTTSMLELLPKDLHLSNDLFFESIPSFGDMPFFYGFNPNV